MPVEIDTKQFKAAMKKLRRFPRDQASRRRIFGRFGSYMEGELIRRRPTSKIKIRHSYNSDGATIGSPTVFARIMHFGGTIYASGDPRYKAPHAPLRSRKGSLSEVTGKPIKYLAIPINARKNTRPRDYKNTFVFESKKGNLLIAQRAKAGRFTGRGGYSKSAPKQQGAMNILFVLKKSVKYPAKPYADPKPKDRRKFMRLVIEEMNPRL